MNWLLRTIFCRLLGHTKGWYPCPPWHCERCGDYVKEFDTRTRKPRNPAERSPLWDES